VRNAKEMAVYKVARIVNSFCGEDSFSFVRSVWSIDKHRDRGSPPQ
jgi:hypothetical protein